MLWKRIKDTLSYQSDVLKDVKAKRIKYRDCKWNENEVSLVYAKTLFSLSFSLLKKKPPNY